MFWRKINRIFTDKCQRKNFQLSSCLNFYVLEKNKHNSYIAEIEYACQKFVSYFHNIIHGSDILKSFDCSSLAVAVICG